MGRKLMQPLAVALGVLGLLSAGVAPASAAVSNTALPQVVAASYRVGSTLYADPGSWSGHPTSFSFQWQKCKLDPTYTCQDIAGATGATHVVTDDDNVWTQAGFDSVRSFMFGIRIVVKVTASDGGSSVAAASRLDSTLPSAAPAAVGGSTQTFGAPPAGVAAIDGAISPVPDCSGNTGPLCTNPLGHYLKIGGRYSLPERGTLSSFAAYFAGGASAQSFTPAVYAVDGSGLPTSLVVTGTPFTVSAGAPAGWFTSSLTSTVTLDPGTYVLTFLGGDTDRGAIPYFYIPAQSIGYANSNTNLTEGTPGYLEQSLVPSNPFGTVEHFAGEMPKAYVTYTAAGATTSAPGSTAAPTLTGTAQQGQTLTASTGSWSGSPTGYTYAWQQCDASGSSCADLAGQVASSYTAVAGDVGHTLRVRVRGVNAGGISSPAASGVSAVVADSGAAGSAPTLVSAPAVSGTTQAGSTLSAAPGTWLDAGSYGYQWQRCSSTGTGCLDVAAAVGTTFVLTSLDIGSTLRVVVTATNTNGSTPGFSSVSSVVSAASPGGGGSSGGGGGGGGGTSTPAPGIPDLHLSWSPSSAAPSLGGQATLDLTIRNVGNGAAAGSQLSISLPSIVSLVSTSIACSGTGSVTCSLPALGAGAAVDVQVVVKGTAAGSGVVTGAVSIAGDANPADDTATTSLTVPRAGAVVAAPALDSVKPSPRSPVAGKTFVLAATYVRRDTGSALATVTPKVQAMLGRKSLTCKTTSKGGKVTVTCKVPLRTAGQRLRITVGVKTTGGSSTRTFAFTVRRV